MDSYLSFFVFKSEVDVTTVNSSVNIKNTEKDAPFHVVVLEKYFSLFP